MTPSFSVPYSNPYSQMVPKEVEQSDPQAMIEALTTRMNGSVVDFDGKVSHHPYGYSHKVTKEQWAEAFWPDPKVPKKLCDYITTTAKWEELVKWLFPHFSTGDDVCPLSYTMRGLLQLYEEKRPFANEERPTIPEIESWFIECVNLLRRLVGITVEVKPEAYLFILATLSNQAEYTDIWDDCDNPCRINENADGSVPMHCGFEYIRPERCQARAQQLQEGYCSGMNTTVTGNEWKPEGWYWLKTYTPWSMFFTGAWRDSFIKEGITGGHVKYFFTHGTIGFNVYYGGYDAYLRTYHGGPVESYCGVIP
jgi:hypothetical protein